MIGKSLASVAIGNAEVRPKASVIIVTYNSGQEISGCLESVLRQLVPHEIFVVDNASSDNTAEIAGAYAERSANIHLILNEKNIGLAAANNSPLGRCRGDYVLILNPDTLLREDALVRLGSFLDANPDVGVAGPKNVYGDGTPHSSFHRHWTIFHVLLWRVLPYRVARTLYDRFSSYEYQDLLFVSGACLMMRRNIFEHIRGYDSEYFLTVEDACDLCIRARNYGGRIVLFPDAEVVHLGGRSGMQAPYTVVWHGHRGSIYHFLKHKGVVQASVVLVLLLVSSGLRAIIGGVLGIFASRYLKVARIYGRVFWNLLLHNPIREKRGAAGYRKTISQSDAL
jgi:GT2 family glycosyltransferase